MHAYAIIEVSAGRPNVNFSTTPVAGYVLAAGPIGNYGLYLVGGSAAQLAAVNALPNVVGLVDEPTIDLHMSIREDERFLKSDKGQQKVAESIFSAVRKYKQGYEKLLEEGRALGQR